MYHLCIAFQFLTKLITDLKRCVVFCQSKNEIAESKCQYSWIDNALMYLQWSPGGGIAQNPSLPLPADFSQPSFMCLILRILTTLKRCWNKCWSQRGEVGVGAIIWVVTQVQRNFFHCQKQCFKDDIHHRRDNWKHEAFAVFHMWYVLFSAKVPVTQ